MKRPRIGVIADDLTGALDTAGAFASCGLRSRVLTAPSETIGPGYAGEALCINTQTRNVDAALAIAPAHRAAKELIAVGCGLLFKKIDSTARGNPAAECLAVMEAGGAATAIVCPAFPGMGRTTVDGVVLVDGVPVTGTAEGSDHLSPVQSGSMLAIMSIESQMTPGLVPLAVVREGEGAIGSRVDHLTERGCNAIVVDAQTESDLLNIAEFAVDRRNLVIVGSAGLARAIGESISGHARPHFEMQGTRLPVVLVAGSRHEATRRQVETLHAEGFADVITMDPDPVQGKRAERVKHYRQLIEQCQHSQASERNVVLTWDETDPRSGAESAGNAAASLTNFAGTVVYQIIRHQRPGALVVAGGDTAFGVLRALGASTVEVTGETEAGVPLGVIQDGVGHGMTLVTKAGGFGDDGMLIRVLQRLAASGGPLHGV